MDLYWIWLSTIKGIGPVTQKKLLAVFQTPERIYRVDREELVKRTSLRTSFIDLLLAARSLEKARQIQDNLAKHDIRLLTSHDQLYPKEVRAVPTSPVVLYYRGHLRENSMGVAIIGSRRCTGYGKQVAAEAATYLAGHGVPVISGMARGIDGYAHTACLKAGGYTLAFLANGLDICYPPEHQLLMEHIIANGAVISPYPPQTRPVKSNFYQRNALLSAWSGKVLVVEAGMRSGALLTAEFAAQQNRTVLAVPNSIYSPESAGTNQLISRGAEILLSFQQLLPAALPKQPEIPPEKTEKQLSAGRQAAQAQLPPLEKQIIERLQRPQDMEQLADIFVGELSALLDILCTMELEGKIKISQGKTVVQVL